MLKDSHYLQEKKHRAVQLPSNGLVSCACFSKLKCSTRPTSIIFQFCTLTFLEKIIMDQYFLWVIRVYLSVISWQNIVLNHRGRFHHDIPILIIDWSPKDISLEVKTLILLQLLITQGYRHPGICLYEKFLKQSLFVNFFTKCFNPRAKVLLYRHLVSVIITLME